jgi:hypothetical protein
MQSSFRTVRVADRSGNTDGDLAAFRYAQFAGLGELVRVAMVPWNLFSDFQKFFLTRG